MFVYIHESNRERLKGVHLQIADKSLEKHQGWKYNNFSLPCYIFFCCFFCLAFFSFLIDSQFSISQPNSREYLIHPNLRMVSLPNFNPFQIEADSINMNYKLSIFSSYDATWSQKGSWRFFGISLNKLCVTWFLMWKMNNRKKSLMTYI